jgi:D-serine deaminase-like pyridoxal phosphate-dependent protein
VSERRSLVGKPAEVIVTPALVLDPDALEANLTLMAEGFRGRPCRVRPHFKGHKCVTVAHRQLAAGSIAGITCAKLAEAEQCVAGGVRDVLVANQVVGEEKTRRLAALNRGATVRVAVDSLDNIAELGEAARQANVTIGVLVEVDIGMARCGVRPGPETLALAEVVTATEGLRFDGLQGYEGHAVMIPDPEERRRRVVEAMGPLTETRRALEAAGMPVRIVSGGGTGTYDSTGKIEGIDEVQAGSYALMDAAYKKVRPEFAVARTVLTTVISVQDGYAIADVGSKGVGCEFGPPSVADHPEAEVVKVSEEHVKVVGLRARVGDRVTLIPSHGCTTNNLYRKMYVVKGGRIEDVWPIEGSGCVE